MQVGGDKVPRAGVQRLVELAVELLLIADLHPGQPFGAQGVDAVYPVTGADVEGAVAAHVVGQVKPQPQVVGAAAFAARADDQGSLFALVHHAVLHLFEVIQPVQRAHVPLQTAQIQRLTHRLADVVANHRVANFRIVFDLDGGDDRGALFRGTRRIELGIGRLAQTAHAVGQNLGGAVAGVDDFLRAAKVRHAITGQRGLDQDVVRGQGGQLHFGVAAGHQRDGLIEDVEYRVQLLAAA